MKFGSLFAGVGGFDIGLENAGWECAFQVEWDPHCQQTLGHHWPNVPKWGDVSDVNGAELPPVDVITFGSPCQDLSVAGKRAGLTGGDRSNLFFQATRIIREMKEKTNGEYPRIAIWENVPGALSSNGGDDFETVLQEMADCGSYHLEWAILDAQFFGVPQRRRRVFVIAVLDPAIAGKCGSQILAVGESRRRNTKKSKSKRENTTPNVASSLRVGSGIGERGDGSDNLIPVTDIAPTLRSGGDGGVPSSRGEHLIVEPRLATDNDVANCISAALYHRSTVVNQDVNNGHLVVESLYPDVAGTLGGGSGDRGWSSDTDRMTFIPVVNPALIIDGTRVDDIRIYDDGITPTLKNRMGTGGNNVPFVGFSHTQGLDAQPSEIAWPTLRSEGGGHAVAIPIQDARPVDKKQNGLGIGNEGDPMFTLDRVSQPAAAIPIQGTIIGRSDTAGPQGPGFGQEGDPMYTVDTISQHGVAVAYDEYNDTLNGDVHHSLRAGTRQSTGVVAAMSVRRLTPIECERLMGWPDNHTLHRADGKTNSDTTRYKMCGNGVASPVAQWIAEQINAIQRD